MPIDTLEHYRQDRQVISHPESPSGDGKYKGITPAARWLGRVPNLITATRIDNPSVIDEETLPSRTKVALTRAHDLARAHALAHALALAHARALARAFAPPHHSLVAFTSPQRSPDPNVRPS